MKTRKKHMKKWGGGAFIVCFLLLVTGALAACSPASLQSKLFAPTNIKVEGNTLRWNSVDNAAGYTVKIDESEYSTGDNEYPLALPMGEYRLSVKALGDGTLYVSSDYGAPVIYQSYGVIADSGSSATGAFGAFDDLSRFESYLGYGFDVIRSNEFSSKTVKISNPVFKTDELLKQRLLKVKENRADVNVIQGSSIDQFMDSWNASLNVDVKWGLKKVGGSVSVSGKVSATNEKTNSEYFYGIDIYNQSHYLILQSDLDTYRSILADGFKKDLYDASVSPSALFDRYGTHFITSAVMGGRLTSYYHMESEEKKSLLDIAAKVDVEVRYLVGKTNVGVEGGYRKEASEQHINISNTLGVIGGDNFGMLSDMDIAPNYAAWEKSLNDKPALMGIKDASSLWQIWDLIETEKDIEVKFGYIDETGVARTGTRAQQLQAYFFKYGVDSYNDMMNRYGIREIKVPESIGNVRVNNQTVGADGVFTANTGSSAQITFLVYPEDALGYTATYSLVQNQYATISNSGELTIESSAPNNTILEVTVGAGSVRQTIRIRVNRVYSVFFESSPGSPVAPLFGVNENALIPRPLNPARQYYTFAGWYTDGARKLPFDFNNTPVDGNLTLYAQWTPTQYGVPLYDGQRVIGTLYTDVEKGFALTAPAAFAEEKEGYTFGGWYADANFQTVFSFAGAEYQDGLKIYAKFTLNRYTVQYYANTGSTADDRAFYNVGHGTSPVPQPEILNAPNGKVFGGWFTSADFGEADRVNPATETVTGNLTLYARWVVNTLSVLFVTNTPETPDFTEASYVYGDLVARPSGTSVAKKGYYIGNWYTDAGLQNVWNFDARVVVADMTLYAGWSPAVFTVTYENLTEGGTHSNPAVYTVESEDIVFSAPERAGYTGSWTTVGIPQGSVGDRTITAVWTPIEYEITYTNLLNGTNPADNPLKYTIVNKITFSAPERTGYTGAWDPGFISEGTYGNKTVAAVWTLIAYEINYDLPSGGTTSNVGTYTIEDEITFTAPVRDGYAGKWDIAGIPLGSTGDKTITPIWVKTVYYDEVRKGEEVQVLGYMQGLGFAIMALDQVAYDLDKASLRAWGYTKFTIFVDFDMREVDDGYQDLTIATWTGYTTTNMGIKLPKDYAVIHSHLEEHTQGSIDTAWFTHLTATATVNIDDMVHPYIGLFWSSHGNGANSYMLGHTRITVTAVK
ncbi:hypothetical protein FACS1894211_14990 [Clostridia bacterium]|nr:hypothetical protein FACS1894211_14990 [Clostridia bacterium]